MAMTPSAYQDTFARDHLPPADQWPVLEFTTPELQHPDRVNAAVAILDATVDRLGPDRPALRTPQGETWSYGELQQRVDQIAQVLVDDLGLRPGNRVLLRAPNTPLMVAAWLATLKAGGIATTVFAALRSGELTPVITATRPVIALVDHRFLVDVETVRDEVAPQLTIVPMGGSSADDLFCRIQGRTGSFTAIDTAGDDVALFCPTSGTTGVPKITTHFHRDLLSIDATFGRTVLQLTPDDIVACTAPFAFTFGLGMLVVFPLRAGACALLTDGVAPAPLADLVAEHRVTVLATAPTAYRQILKAGQGDQLKGLRMAVSAGEHISLQTWDELRDLGLDVVDGIGGTELLHIFLSAAGADVRRGATGKPLPGYRAAILDPDGRELPAGAEGRLAVIGPVGCRYLADDRQTAYVQHGWNVTGDTFRRDEDGYFYYCARTDDMIVSSGYNIGAPEVEAALHTHPDVLECAVIGRPDADRGAVVCAFVVLGPGVTESAELVRELQDHVKARLAPYKYPRDIRFCAALPRNTSGKVQHFQLRRMAASAQVS